jgi:UDP-N-acetylmuramoyl-L-alanyl-D-glutamate--2,6-diaminopimelate ligase
MLIPLHKNRQPVSLMKLFPTASFVGCADIPVIRATDNSKDCCANSLFAAISGTNVDGAHFIEEAIDRGAAAILCDHPRPEIPVPQCIVPHVRTAYAKLCHALYHQPGERLKTIGITGTNGKTTTTYLVRSILNAAGFQTGLLGTIEYSDGKNRQESKLTTPDPLTLAKWFNSMLEQGTSHVVLEMSSHAMHQGRTAGVDLDVAIMTNITHDHLDYHHTLEHYIASKSRIIDHCKLHASLILNSSDEHIRNLGQSLREDLNVIWYSRPDSKVQGTVAEQSPSGMQILLQIENQTYPVFTNLIGQHNLSNCLAAAAACVALGIESKYIAEGIENLTGVPGRLERIDAGQPYHIFVDYAHTDDALKRCISTLRQLTKNRLICVFGAGGDRDRTKRPKLAKATMDADIVIVTSDNPRSERPRQIIEDIVRGFASGSPRVYIEEDRKQAIQLALELSEPGDTLLVAGKGHETYQQIGNTRLEFDDRSIIRSCLTPEPVRSIA